MSIDLVVTFDNHLLFQNICGIADSKIPFIESLLAIDLVPRGHTFILKSENEALKKKAVHFFDLLKTQYPISKKIIPEEFDLKYIFHNLDDIKQKMQTTKMSKKSDTRTKNNQQDLILTNDVGKQIYPRTIRQAEFVTSAFMNEITLCKGPAGTGKTFLSTAVACSLFLQGKIERIVLTRPAVEAGESLGFLPGDLSQKVDPYLRPLFDALYECMGTQKVNDLIDMQKIEIAPLAFMRGRTLNDSFVILDEAQNCTLPQLKMFMTRLGKNSRMCIGGDTTQIDLPYGKSGFQFTTELLDNIPGIGIVEFNLEDIIRNPLVEKIVAAFNRAEKVE